MSRQLTERDRAKRRNTAVVMVLAVAACVAGMVLAVGTLGQVSDDAADQLVPETTPPSVPVDAAAPAPPADGSADPAPTASTPAPAAPQTLFTSPTGNISCTISEAGARCDIAEKTWDPGAKPAACTAATWGSGVVVDGNGPQVVCADASLVGGGGGVLAYGRDVTVGDYACSSSEAGMRCVQSSTGRGFALSRRAYTFF